MGFRGKCVKAISIVQVLVLCLTVSATPVLATDGAETEIEETMHIESQIVEETEQIEETVEREETQLLSEETEMETDINSALETEDHSEETIESLAEDTETEESLESETIITDTDEEISDDTILIFATANSSVRMSTNGQNFIKRFEGGVPLPKKYLTAYDDGFGTWTIGWGHTAGVKRGMKITEAQAQKYFEQDLAKKEAIVKEYEKKEGIKFTQQQYDALVSLVYNLSTNPLGSSTYRLTKAIKKYQSGSKVNIPTEAVWECFATWHHAGGVDVKGLFNRRLCEARIFSMGDYTLKTDWKTPSWLVNGKKGPEVPDGWVPEEYKGKVPAAPKISSVTVNSSSSMTVRWEKVSGASSYDVYRRKSGEPTGFKNYTKIKSKTTSTSYQDSGLAAGTKYYYIIVAKNSSGDSKPSDNMAGTTKKKYYLNLNGYLDTNAEAGNIKGYGTADVYINGKLAANDVNDYYQQVDEGSSFEFKDIKTVNGKYYYGVTKGALKGTISSSAQTTVLHFGTICQGGTKVLPEGKYVIISALDQTKGLDVDNGGKTNATNLQLWTFTGVNNQIFTLRYHTEGYYSLTDVNSGLSIHAQGSGSTNGTNLHMWNSENGANARWVIKKTADGYYNLITYCSSMYMDVAGGKSANGTNIQIYTGNGRAAQKFMFIPYEYTVSYNANGGSEAPAAQTKIYGKPLTLSETKPTRAGYTFQGWAADETGSVTYMPGSEYTDNTARTLYAVWKKIPVLTMRHNINGGVIKSDRFTSSSDGFVKQGDEEVTVIWEYGYSSIYGLWDAQSFGLSREGYQFAGWSLSKDGSTTVFDQADQTVTPEKIYPELKNGDATVILYAVWEQLEIPVEAAISVVGCSAAAGQEISIPVTITNNPGLISAEFSVQYDRSVLEWTGVEMGDFAGSFDGTPGSDITWYAEDPRTNVTTDGVIAILKFKVKDGVTAAETDITITYDADDVFNADEENVALRVIPGTVKIDSYLPGDINGDGIVNNKDVTRLMRHIKYQDVEVVKAALDVNGDGIVNNKDVTRLMRYIKYTDVEIH